MLASRFAIAVPRILAQKPVKVPTTTIVRLMAYDSRQAASRQSHHGVPDIQSLLIITAGAANGRAEPKRPTETLTTEVAFTVLTATVTSMNIQK